MIEFMLRRHRLFRRNLRVGQEILHGQAVFGVAQDNARLIGWDRNRLTTMPTFTVAA